MLPVVVGLFQPDAQSGDLIIVSQSGEFDQAIYVAPASYEVRLAAIPGLVSSAQVIPLAIQEPLAPPNRQSARVAVSMVAGQALISVTLHSSIESDHAFYLTVYLLGL